MNVEQFIKNGERLEAVASEEAKMLGEIMDGAMERKVKVMRDNGEEKEITEAQMFEEVRLGGKSSREKAEELYPKLFTIVKEREKLEKEQNEEWIKEMGFPIHEITPSRFVRSVALILKNLK